MKAQPAQAPKPSPIATSLKFTKPDNDLCFTKKSTRRKFRPQTSHIIFQVFRVQYLLHIQNYRLFPEHFHGKQKI